MSDGEAVFGQSAGGSLSTDDDVLDRVPLERLEAEICGFASRIAAATAQWLVWIAAYDRRRGWESWEAKSCAHWLNWKCGMSPRRAREHVLVARKLEEFSLVRERFLAGELSFSKVRAICRVATSATEAELVRLAKDTTASQLDRIVAKMPDPNREPGEPGNPDNVVFQPNGDGTTTMLLTLPIAEMAEVRQAVQAKAGQVIDRQTVDGETKRETIARMGGVGAIHADTAAALITGQVDAAEGATASVLVVADLDVLTGADESAESTVDQQRVDPSIVKRLCCDGAIQAAVESDGQIVAAGSEVRIVPRRLRRLLLRRDHGMCQFPGCEAIHRLHAHHVIHWVNGGKTELPNLISLCHFHHHAVHERGWNIKARSSNAGWIFIDAQNKEHRVPILRLPMSGPLPLTRATENGAAAPLAGLGERCDTAYIADNLSYYSVHS